MKPSVLLLSCEHAVDSVPPAYQALFAPFSELLASHRAIDFGALSIAEYLKEYFDCKLIQADVTRLLVDCNRSTRHSECFSEVTRGLDAQSKQAILHQYYLPFREQVTHYINTQIKAGFQVWHLSIHSFTPVLNNQIRTAEIGLLYDPRRLAEKKLASHWQQQLKQADASYRIRLNYPYLGVSDGFTRTLRRTFCAEHYLGVELEVNQALSQDEQSINTLKRILANSLFKTRTADLMLS